MAFIMGVWTSGVTAAPGGKSMPNPDLTKGDPIPEGATHDWNLGALGARGWMFTEGFETTQARQIAITSVDPDGPAADVLEVGDVILGVANTPFSYDPRVEFGKALTQAETEAGGGKLSMIRFRDGKAVTVVATLPVLGTYSPTAPFDCPKSTRILEQGCATLAERIIDPSYKENAIPRSLNALALLASGNDDYLPVVAEEAKWAAAYETKGFATWYYGYVSLFLSEYVLRTGDQSVMPGLTRIVGEAVKGQSDVGSWGHRFAMPDGRLPGYGMMNSPGIPLTIGLVLARKAGVDVPGLDLAIERSLKLLRFYAGKGSIPYGDHKPWIQTHDDNGKNGMAAVLFQLVDEPEPTRYFSHMSVASHGPERDMGHTGNFFNITWAMPGIAMSGPNATGAWMHEFGGRYADMARTPDGSFVHLGPPQQRNDSYANWDCTGAYMLAYAMPLKNLYITGKGGSIIEPIDQAKATALIEAGRGWSNSHRREAYDALSTDTLIARLGSWSPVVRERAAMALGRRSDDVIDRLIDMLDSPQLYARLGACQAIQFQRERGETAVDALLATLTQADDMWLRIRAAEALSGIGEPARDAAPIMLKRMTMHDKVNDPRNMEQRYITFALFGGRSGLLGKSLEGIDRDLLFEAVRAGLLNQDGRSRGTISSVYKNLTFDELKPLLPAIHRAIVEPAPSGIMFADGIRTAGLRLFAKHKVGEGIELLADYARNMKKHGSQKRIIGILKLLESYGTHAQRVIPMLEETADYFENREEGFPKRLSQDKARYVRETIANIKASTDTPRLIELNLDESQATPAAN